MSIASTIIDRFFRSNPGRAVALALAIGENDRLRRRNAQLESVVERQHDAKTMSAEMDHVERAKLSKAAADAHACAEASEKRVRDIEACLKHERDTNALLMREVAALKETIRERDERFRAERARRDELEAIVGHGAG